MSLQAAEFTFFSELLKKRSGMALSEDKGYLIESRLLPIARSHGCAGILEFINHIKAAPKETVLTEITEAMTVNESLFFRDGKPFDFLRKTLLPAYKGKSLRIWSAACSTGQEPYSIAMCLQEEAAKLPGLCSEIIATDLAGKVLDKAREGIYSQFEMQRGLPIQMLVKYFTQLPSTSWQTKDILRGMVTYKMQNLLHDLTPLGRFDLIFCRNVLIYFDEATRAGLSERMAKLLQPGGYLLLGSTETLIDNAKFFIAIDACRGLYQLK